MHAQISAMSGPFRMIPKASLCDPGEFEAVDMTCEQGAKEGSQFWTQSKEHGRFKVRSSKEISATV